jgi:hypothetical protein
MPGINVSVSYDSANAVSAVSSLVVKVNNNDVLPIGVKVVTQHPDWYYVTPARAYVAPKSVVEVTLALRPPSELPAGLDGDLPLGDLIRFEIRALISVTVTAVSTLPLAEFADHWKRGIPQSSETVDLKLRWMSAEEHADHLVKTETARHFPIRAELESEQQRLAVNTSRLQTMKLKLEAYDADLTEARRRLDQHRSVIGVHWVVAIIAALSSFVAAAGVPNTVEFAQRIVFSVAT